MVRAQVGKRLVLFILSLSMCLLFCPGIKTYAASSDQLLILVGDALAKAGSKNWPKVENDLLLYQQEWNVQKKTANSSICAEVDGALSKAHEAMKTASTNPKEAFRSISHLAKVTDKYLTSMVQPTQKSGKAEAKLLQASMQKCLDFVMGNQLQQAKICNQQFTNEWSKNELLIRNDSPAIYGLAETKISLVRIYVQTEPVDQAKVSKAMQELIGVLRDYGNGSVQPSTTNKKDSLASAIQLLIKADEFITKGQPTQAAGQMQLFIQKWPNVEGVVQVKAPELYTKIENQMALATSYLVSSPRQEQKAAQVIKEMKTALQGISDGGSYTAWDAGIVLFREGLEAVCVLAALLAFLKQSKNEGKRKWIWSGAVTGILLSIGIAFLLHAFLTTMSAGSTREMIEGITGIVAVIMMIMVGVWLHSQANIKNWNKYVEQKVGSALAAGSLWSLFAVSALSVLREGAETVIFYMGMAPLIKTDQLIIGMCVALILLLIIGFVVIILSNRVPFRLFFMIAAFFIYYLTIKFMGQSIHSLQVANQFPAHSSDLIPTISWLGIYPTWESMIAQLVVLLLIIGLAF